MTAPSLFPQPLTDAYTQGHVVKHGVDIFPLLPCPSQFGEETIQGETVRYLHGSLGVTCALGHDPSFHLCCDPGKQAWTPTPLQMGK